jgi:predicted nucleotidyltransferase
MKYDLEKEVKSKTYKRSTAKKALEMIKEKIEEANAREDFVYQIDKTVLFGSYINSQRETLGDIDIALYLSPKRIDIDEISLNRKRANDVGFSGDFIIECIYGKEEVAKYVKNRKCVVSIHDGKKAEIESKEFNEKVCYIYLDKYEVIYEKK